VRRVAAEPESSPDPFPKHIEVRRARRRTIELSLRDGQLVASVPLRMPQRDVSSMLAVLREDLWERWQRDQVFTNTDLHDCAERARKSWLSDLDLPPFTVRFAGRMQKRWASCTSNGDEPGSLRVSRNLVGHPRWLLEHVLHHELIHLRIPNHGKAFQELLARSPHEARAAGYLEALEHGSQWGDLRIELIPPMPVEDDFQEKEGQLQLPLSEHSPSDERDAR